MPAPDLFPVPFSVLVDRLDREALRGDEIYGVRSKDHWTPRAGVDVGIDHLGRHLDTPAGPASGPHTQLAQNLVMSWLCGGRFMELKTVQVNDSLEIPRPCIFVPHVGYNVEWSQELKTEQSALEYVKGWMLVHLLASEAMPGPWRRVGAAWDVSLGYDLAGIRTDKVRRYLDQLRDASGLIARLRDELSGPLARYRDVPVPAEVSDAITLSTFHGCPADEIEAIASQTLDWGWHTVVKLNPTLLGYERCRALLDAMGYTEAHVQIHQSAFQKDLQWEQLLAMIPRLEARARSRGLGFGVKLSNTLVMHSPEPPFTVSEMYLSGPPLHVLAMSVAADLRAAFPDLTMTFSAGIEARNFAETVAAGLGPVTSCSDLLKGGGYGRMTRYVRALEDLLQREGHTDVAALRASRGPDALAALARGLPQDLGYHRITQSPPKKVGSHLDLLDCLTCDKCIPVCPNGANFAFDVPMGAYGGGIATWADGALSVEQSPPMVVGKRHQIGNVPDACNLCGQCDPWCPEDGGPYLVKPNLFLSSESFEAHPGRDGFVLHADRRGLTWRRAGQRLSWTTTSEGRARLELDGGALELEGDTPVRAEGAGRIELWRASTLRLFFAAFTAPEPRTWLPSSSTSNTSSQTI